MFERYTEKARRVILYGRYEASELGGEQIETDFLLLGVARENPELAMRWLGVDYEQLREMLTPLYAKNERIETDLDMSLSNASNRTLAYAAEEADRLRNRHIGTEHLFLGLLREGGTTERMLKARRENLKSVRKGIAGDPDRQEMKAARSSAERELKVVAEDGREIAVIPWPGQLPKVGEAIGLLNAENIEITYRILDVRWCTEIAQTTPELKEPEIRVTVRAEET